MDQATPLLNYGVGGAVIFVVVIFLRFLCNERKGRAKERKEEREAWARVFDAERMERERSRDVFVEALQKNTAAVHELGLQCERAQAENRKSG